jgi:hypothetical protein
MVADLSGYQDAAWLGCLLQPGGDVDTISEDVPILGNDVADVDSYAQARRLVPVSTHWRWTSMPKPTALTVLANSARKPSPSS